MDVDSLDRHMKNETGLDCRKVVEKFKTVMGDGVALTNATASDPSDQCCWEMKMDVDVDKVICTIEMEVD